MKQFNLRLKSRSLLIVVRRFPNHNITIHQQRPFRLSKGAYVAIVILRKGRNSVAFGITLKYRSGSRKV